MPDPATFEHADRCRDLWRSVIEQTAQVGAHLFYRATAGDDR